MTKFITLFKNKYIASALVFASVFTLGFTANTHAVRSDNCDASNTISGSIPTTPAFNVWQISYDPNQDCHDGPLIDVANPSSTNSRDARLAQSQSEHDQGINAQVNDVVAASIYFHNGATDDANLRGQTTAHDVIVSANVDTSASQRHAFSGSISASNAQGADSGSAGGSAFVNTADPTTLQYVPGSAYLCIGYDAAVDRGLTPGSMPSCGVGNTGKPSVAIQLPDSVLSGGVNIGDIKACFPFSGFVVFRMKVIGQQVTPPPVNGFASLSISKHVENTTTSSSNISATETNANQNERVAYHVTVTNTSSAVAHNVVVTDNGVSGVQLDSNPISGNQSIGDLQPNDSKTFDYNGTVTATSGDLLNTAYAQADNASQVSAQAIVHAHQVNTPPPPPPPTNQFTTLSVTKSVSNTSSNSGFGQSTNAQRGESLSYSIVVTNTGSATAHNVIVSDTGVSGITADTNIPQSKNLGDISAGASQTVNYNATVSQSASAGDYLNTVNAQADNASQTSAQAVVHVTVPNTPPPPPVNQFTTLSITKNVSNNSHNSGFGQSTNAQRTDSLTYRIVVTNTGSVAAHNVMVTDTGVSGITADISIPQGKNVGDIAPGANQTITYNASVSQSAAEGDYINTVNAQADNASQTSAQAIVHVTVPVVPPPTNPSMQIIKLVSNTTTGSGFAHSVNAKNGDQLTYKITVTNTGDVDLPNVQIQDSGAQFINADGNGQALRNPSTIGTLPVGGQPKTLTYNATVSAANITSTVTATNTATATSGSIIVRDQAQVVIGFTPPPPPSSASLSITKLVRDTQRGDNSFVPSITNAQNGDTVEFQISVQNTSNVAATNVRITDSLPGQLTNPNPTSTGLFTSGGFNTGTLGGGQTVVVTFTATVNLVAGNVINTAYAQADNAPQVSAQASVTVVNPQGSLTVIKKVRNVTRGGVYDLTAQVQAGDVVSYLVTVTNSSGSTVNNIIINDVGVSGITFGIGIPQGLNMGSLDAGKSGSISYTGTVNSGNCGSSLLNTVTAKGDNAPQTSAQATVTVQCITPPPQNATMTITKLVRDVQRGQNDFTSSVNNAQNGDTVEFQITIQNTSSVMAHGVVITDQFPTSSLQDVSGLQGQSLLSPSGLQIGDLGAGQSWSYKFSAKVLINSGTITNTAIVTWSNSGTAQSSAIIIVSTPLPPLAHYDLTVTKAVRDVTQGQTAYTSSTNVYANDQVMYQIVVQNTGDTQLTNLNITDNIPSGITVNSGSLGISNMSVGNNTVGNIIVPSLGVGQQVTINFTAQVSSTATGSLTNTVTASANGVTKTASAVVNLIAQPQFGTITLTKLVKNITQNPNASFTSNQAVANPGDRIAYQIMITAQGGDATNITLTDTLPNLLTMIPGTCFANKLALPSNFPASTVNLGNLSSGQQIIIYCEATVSSNMPQGQTVLTNTATASADHQGVISASASVTVNVNIPPASGFNQLSITKLAQNITFGNAQSHNIHAYQNDRVAFFITVQNSGTNTLNNVYVTDTLQSGLTYQQGTTKLDNTLHADGLLSGGRVNLGTMTPGQQHVIYFETSVAAAAGTTVQNTAIAFADNTPQMQDTATVSVLGQVLGTTVNLVQSKSAFNETKNIDATAVPAEKENYITYTLTVMNTGNAPATNYIFSDDLTNVLNYTAMVDLKGGTLNGNVISWPAETVPAGGSVTHQFRVRVSSFLPANAGGLNLVNTFGNTVTIILQSPVVLGIHFVAPKTGASATVGFIFAALLTFAIAFLEKKGYLRVLLEKLPKIKIQ